MAPTSAAFSRSKEINSLRLAHEGVVAGTGWRYPLRSLYRATVSGRIGIPPVRFPSLAQNFNSISISLPQLRAAGACCNRCLLQTFTSVDAFPTGLNSARSIEDSRSESPEVSLLRLRARARTALVPGDRDDKCRRSPAHQSCRCRPCISC
jgi:hypothetical protein